MKKLTSIFVFLSAGLLSAAPPANDNFASRVVLNGLDVVVNATLSDATAEANERTAAGTIPPAGSSLDPSIWYEWTPTTSGVAAISAIPTAPDTSVAATAWTGGLTLATILPAGSCSDGTFWLRIQAGTKYFFQLSTFGNNWGAFRFEIHVVSGAAVLGMDSIAGAFTVSGNHDLLRMSASPEDWLDRGAAGFPTAWDTPSACGWLKWTAPSSGLFGVAAFGGGRPRLQRPGDIPVDDVRVDVLTFGGGGAITRHNAANYETQWSATSGVTYYFRVSTHRSREWLTANGANVWVSVSPAANTDTPGGTPATLAPGGLTTVAVGGLGAEVGTNLSWIHATSYDAWARVSVLIEDEYEARLVSGPGFRLQVYGKDSSGVYHLAGSGTEEDPHVRFDARSDRTYYVRIQLVNSEPYASVPPSPVTVALESLFSASKPPNDRFFDATVIDATQPAFLATFNLREATTGEGEDSYAVVSGTVTSLPHRSVWFSYTPSSTRDLHLSALDHVGNSVPIIVATGTPGSFSHVSNGDFTATAGTTYRIRVDLETQQSCPWVTFRLSQAADDNFPGIASSASSLSALISNHNATVQAGEPTSGNESGSVWRTWTPTASGSAVITTFGSEFDTVLRVYTGSAVNALTLIAENDDLDIQFRATSGLRLNVTAGTPYRIRITGYNQKTGQVALRIRHEGLEGTASPLTYWAQHFPGISGSLLADPGGDPDGDGLPTGVEMALHTEPLVSQYDPCNSSGMPVATVVSGGFLRFIYPRVSKVLTDLTSSDRDWVCLPETSANLTNWTTATATYDSGTGRNTAILNFVPGQKSFIRLWVGDSE